MICSIFSAGEEALRSVGGGCYISPQKRTVSPLNSIRPAITGAASPSTACSTILGSLDQARSPFARARQLRQGLALLSAQGADPDGHGGSPRLDAITLQPRPAVKITPNFPDAPISRNTVQFDFSCHRPCPVDPPSMKLLGVRGLDSTMGVTSARRSVFSWCGRARSLAGPGAPRSPPLEPRSSDAPGARLLEFIL